MSELHEKLSKLAVASNVFEGEQHLVIKTKDIGKIINICMDAVIEKKPKQYDYAEQGYEAGYNDALIKFVRVIESLK